MDMHTSYSINLDTRYAPLELLDVQALVNACKEPWYNQTLCRVNDCVVRLGVLEENSTGISTTKKTSSSTSSRGVSRSTWKAGWSACGHGRALRSRRA